MAEAAVADVEIPLERLEAQLCDGAAHRAGALDTYDDEDGLVVGMFRLDPDEGAALRAALTLAKEILRDQKRSAERSAGEPKPKPEADDCFPEAIRPKVSNADALALIVETMLSADHHKDISRHERTLVVVHLDGDKA